MAVVFSPAYTDLTDVVLVKSVRVGAKEYHVGEIADFAFYCYDSLKSVEIPRGITKIGSFSFFGCSGLQSIKIPDSVTDIGDCAFTECCRLRSIVVDSRNVIYDSRNDCNAIIETETNRLVLSCKTSAIPDCVTFAYDGAISQVEKTNTTPLLNRIMRIGKYKLSVFSEVSTTEIIGTTDIVQRCLVTVCMVH